jgi:hypothetical protein
VRRRFFFFCLVCSKQARLARLALSVHRRLHASVVGCEPARCQCSLCGFAKPGHYA